MKIYYRISDTGYNKVKPDYINNENCFANFCKVFIEYIHDIHVIADNVSQETRDMLCGYINTSQITYASIGHGAGTFNLALDKALECEDNEIIYFVENDYIHLKGSSEMIREGIKMGAPYVTLYLHPDKFIPTHLGGNPEVGMDGGYPTKIYRGETQLWGMFNSTTMTFASTVQQLKDDEEILRRYTKGTHPDDFRMFMSLRDEKEKSLLCPLNTFSTHGETQWLAPLYKIKQEDLINEWENHIKN